MDHAPAQPEPRDGSAPPVSDAQIASLHARCAPGLVRHFTRLLADRTGAPRPDASTADDLAADTWLVFTLALRKHAFDPAKGGLSTFLYAVAHTVWLRHTRAAARRHAAHQALANLAEARAVHEDDLAAAVILAAELRAVDAILTDPGSQPDSQPGPADRAAAGPFSAEDRDLLRAVSEGASDRQLAQRLAVAPSTATVRRQALLQRVAEFLRNRGF